MKKIGSENNSFMVGPNNLMPFTQRNPLPTTVPKAPPPAPSIKAKSPSFLTLKNIIMDDDSLSAEQKLGLIDKISDLY